MCGEFLNSPDVLKYCNLSVTVKIVENYCSIAETVLSEHETL